jgi:hypothetical protein
VTFVLLLGIRLYLELVALSSMRAGRVRRENALVIGSIEYLRLHYREQGLGSYRAALLALRDNLGELQPFALLQRVRIYERDGGAASIASKRALPVIAGLSLKLTAVVLSVALLMLIVLLIVLDIPAEKRRR